LFKQIRFHQNLINYIVKLAIPITIGQLGLVLMGFADTVMLGRFSTDAMSSASFANAVFFQFIIFGMGLLFAVSTLISIADGEGKPEKSISIFKSSIWVSVIISLIIFSINFFLLNHIDLFGQTPKVTKLGGDYLRIVNYSTPLVMIFYASKQLMDGLGKTLVAMYVTFLGLLLNVFLNWLFIFGNWGIPEMGLKGAAWATNISRLFMMVLMFVLVWYHPIIKQFKKIKSKTRSYIIEIFRLGTPIGFTFFFEIAAFSIGLIFAGWISENSLAAHQIAINLASITYMFVTGIAAAATIVVGNYYGAKDRNGIRHSAKICFYLVVGIELLFALILFLFHKQIPEIYTNDQAVIPMAQTLVLWAAVFQISDGLQAVGAGVLRGIKDTKVTGVIALIAYWFIMIPGSYILAFKLSWGIDGIWIAFVVGLTFAAILLIYRFYHLIRKEIFKFEELS
jgi:multidrug resistance protein, MATE family